MAESLTEDELQVLYLWIDEVPLSRPRRNFARDFSDGCMVAEVVSCYLPKMVEQHNYSAANSVKQKVTNWQLLNQKVFKKLMFQVPAEIINQIAHCKPNMVELVLHNLRTKLDDFLMKTKGISLEQLSLQRAQNASRGQPYDGQEMEGGGYEDTEPPRMSRDHHHDGYGGGGYEEDNNDYSHPKQDQNHQHHSHPHHHQQPPMPHSSQQRGHPGHGGHGSMSHPNDNRHSSDNRYPNDSHHPNDNRWGGSGSGDEGGHYMRAAAGGGDYDQPHPGGSSHSRRGREQAHAPTRQAVKFPKVASRAHKPEQRGDSKDVGHLGGGRRQHERGNALYPQEPRAGGGGGGRAGPGQGRSGRGQSHGSGGGDMDGDLTQQLRERDRHIYELNDMVHIMEEKVQRLEQLLSLKERRIQDLSRKCKEHRIPC